MSRCQLPYEIGKEQYLTSKPDIIRGNTCNLDKLREWEMLTNALRALVNNPFKESFYGEKKNN